MRGTATPKGQPNKRLSARERQLTVKKQRAAVAACAALAVLYIAVSIYYLSHFLPGTGINGIAVGGKAVSDAKAALQAAVEDYSLTVYGPADTEEIIDGNGLALKVTDAPGTEDCLKKQAAFAWPVSFLLNKDYQADLVVSYDAEELDRRIGGLGMMDESAMYPPSDAVLTVREDGSCEITPEKPGTYFDAGKAREMIHGAVGSDRREADLDPLITKPSVYSTDEGLNRRCEEWNRFIGAAGLTYRVCGQNVTLEGPDIVSLLVDDGNNVTVSRGAVEHLVAAWKDKYDTFGRGFDFTTYYGATERIDPNGDYGYELNDEEAVESIITHIENADSGSHELTYWHKPLFDTNGGLGDTYVEIDLRQQHMWVWKEGSVVVDTDIVSGLPVYGRVTYMGCFSIKVMDQDVTLGDVEVEGYSTEVKYWARFNGGEGLHDAEWRDAFGGDIWKYDGSHGCINVPADVMPTVYDSIELGEAVIVYGDPYDESVYTPGGSD